MRSRCNGAPTQDFAICRIGTDGSRQVSRLRWGLIPSWAKDMKTGSRLINARAETADAKPAFRSAFKSPRFISMADGSVASFAVLWEHWDGGEEAVESFTIITAHASPDLARVHARQPAVVETSRFDDWLDPDAPKEELLDMVRQPHSGSYEVRQVSRLVDDARNDSPEVLGAA